MADLCRSYTIGSKIETKNKVSDIKCPTIWLIRPVDQVLRVACHWENTTYTYTLTNYDSLLFLLGYIINKVHESRLHLFVHMKLYLPQHTLHILNTVHCDLLSLYIKYNYNINYQLKLLVVL